MYYLPALPLRNGLQQHLQQAQKKINQLPSYYQQVKQAKLLWQSKKKSNAHKSAFNRIEKTLQQASPYCYYCEGSLGRSIEHFYPKGFYPDLTFAWENYLWSCQTCNTQYKGSKFALFSNPHTHKVTPLIKNKRFVRPANQDAVCLNPRMDDVLDYWVLDITTGKYLIKPTNTARSRARAEYTLQLLQLNERLPLLKGRQKAYTNYLQLLEAMAHLEHAPSQAYLKELLPKKQASFYKQSLHQQQAFAQQYLYQQFIALPFKTVWRSMKQDALNNGTLQELFEKGSKALDW